MDDKRYQPILTLHGFVNGPIKHGLEEKKKRKEKIAGSGPLVHILELISESTFLKIVFQNKNIDTFFVLN